jgi:hypothetical protein
MVYANAFGPGQDLTITVDVPKVEMNGQFSAPTDPRLGINHLSVQPPDLAGGDTTGTVSLDLPAGTYDVTSFHHKRFQPAETDELPRADIDVVDADGARSIATDFFATLNNSGAAEIGSIDFQITSNGIDPVIVTYTNTTPNENLAETDRDFPINGLIIVPSLPDSDADFNSDGHVDAADYVAWRKLGINGGQGYADWKMTFGTVVDNGGAWSGTVPEPSVWVLIGFALAAVVATRCIPGKRRLISPVCNVKIMQR